MRMFKGMIVVAALALVGSTVAEEGFADEKAKTGGIRVGIRNMPGVDEVELEALGSSDTFSVDANAGAQVDVMYVKRFMGPDGKNSFGGLLGGGLYFNGNSGEDVDFKVDLATFGFIAQAGVAWNVADVVFLEIAPFIGLGISSVDLTDKTNTIIFDSGGGAQVLGGIKGAVFVPLGDTIEIGLEGGYIGFATATTIEFPSPFPDADATFSGGGFQGALVMNIKL